MKNYYDILEVSRKASKDTINKVFKMHMKANHPDLFQGAEKTKAEEKSKELTEAYNILSDDASRAKYDEELGAEESQGQYVQVQAIMEENEHLKQIIEKKTKVIDILSSIYGDNEIQSIVNNIDFGDDRFNNGMSSEAQYYSDVQQINNVLLLPGKVGNGIHFEFGDAYVGDRVIGTKIVEQFFEPEWIMRDYIED